VKRYQTLYGLLLVVAFAGFLPAAPTEGDPCTTTLAGWEKLADTSTAVPRFMIEGRLDIERLMVCSDGTYFFFRAREWGRFKRFCLAYPKPSQKEMAKYYGRDEADLQERIKEVLAATAKADQAYAEFVTQLQDVLGVKYAEGRLISFENARRPPRLDVELGQPFSFTWRHRSVSFFALPDVYIAPGSNVPPWVIFLLVYPGPAYR
jgi:hypothetical protein